MKLTLGFSPCPNDTFIFDALVNKKIETNGLTFDVVLEDVQTLNNFALAGKLDVSKISYGVLPLLVNQYRALNSGGALGQGVGPLLIARQTVMPLEEKVNEMTIAIPGQNTTAHLLFSMAFPGAVKKRFLVFNEIEEAVISGAVDAGVIIHENRFTYLQKGLVKLVDLGQYWEEKTKVPIPLGGIIIRKNFQPELMAKVDRLIRQSVEYAFEHYPHLPEYVRQHAQEMDDEVMRQHIELYVNDYSIDLRTRGKTAISKLMEIYALVNKIDRPKGDDYFVPVDYTTW